MTGNARGALRSSARLSTGGGGGAAAAEGASAARAAARSSEAAAAAARRRARAVERAREVEDSPQELREKCKQLAKALRDAKHLVVYTGAGISTAADIPDYRGPRGVWTRLRRGETVGRVEVSMATPTLTHMALTALYARGALKFVVSQNCDGLHVRAGLPRRALAELHGDMFAERCATCRRVYLRSFDTTERTARHAHRTRRLCHRCGAELADTIVHFGERGRAAWPLNWAGALRHAAAADVVLCLGSSLKVLRRYPRLWRMQRAPAARPALYIVNLQWTPKDAVAALKINARCDTVMAQVARRLGVAVPRYDPRRDPLLAHAVPLADPERHTTRRPLLPCPPPPPHTPPLEPDLYSDSDSLSPSDSDDEVPLRRLAERIRGPSSPSPCPALAAPPPAPPPPPPPAPLSPPPRVLPPPRLPPPPDLLHAFQVNMRSGDATILLRAHHAPSVRPPAPLPLPAPTTLKPPASCAPAPLPAPRRPLSDLRMFRFARRPPPAPPPLTNGHALPPPPPPSPAAARHRYLLPPRLHLLPPAPHSNGHIKSERDIKQEYEPKFKPDVEESPFPLAATPATPAARSIEPVVKMDIDLEPKKEVVFDPETKTNIITKFKCEVKLENGGPSRYESDSSADEGGGDEAGGRGAAEASALAAAIIARAVLLCRAELYPGLHTILAPRAATPPPAPPPPPVPAPRPARRRAEPRPAEPRPAPAPAPRAPECAWCVRHYAARRCQWYGPPPADPLASRVWRRARGRRYLCACCGDREREREGDCEREPQDEDGGGWYGKGYRKGRRRRR